MKISPSDIPAEVQQVALTLEENGYEAYLVGGYRDLFWENPERLGPHDKCSSRRYQKTCSQTIILIMTLEQWGQD